MRDALRLAFGTLSVLPVRPPGVVDRRTASRAMVLAPVIGLVLALVVLTLVVLVWPTASPLLTAVLVVAALALLTRGMHLDGLADTFDGLGSRTPADQALALMRQGDIGPFGVVTVVVTLLIQTAAMAQLVTTRFGLGELLGSVLLSRMVLPLLCSSRVRAARADGMGSIVAGSVGPVGATVAVILAAAEALALGALLALLIPAVVPMSTATAPSVFSDQSLHVLSLVLLPLLVTGLFARHCVRRLGGVTGDVLGASVEVTFTVALVVSVV